MPRSTNSFPGAGEEIRAVVEERLGELREALSGIRLFGHCSPAALDIVASFGERLSAAIVAAHLDTMRASRFVDAREFILTDDQYTRASVLVAKTNRATRAYFSFLNAADRPIPVVTGFIGSTIDGRTTTVGRNGSDYTAAIIGARFAHQQSKYGLTSTACSRQTRGLSRLPPSSRR